ncbi:hypothetical protein PENSPDRAFT_672151 [Peniophora sp. CONT]|nr:hypothetical protein PENSPDRAFT_672151 [Peniophora sp. CONT]
MSEMSSLVKPGLRSITRELGLAAVLVLVKGIEAKVCLWGETLYRNRRWQGQSISRRRGKGRPLPHVCVRLFFVVLLFNTGFLRACACEVWLLALTASTILLIDAEALGLGLVTYNVRVPVPGFTYTTSPPAMSLNFSKHQVLADQCVASDPVVRTVDALGRSVKRRVGKVGSLVMLEPSPEANVLGDEVWFGVLTWVQPQKEVAQGKTRLCEVFWVYTKAHILALVANGDIVATPELKKELRRLSSERAWITNHYSDKPLGSILTVPTYEETCQRIKLSTRKFIELDTSTGSCEFTSVGE